MSFYSILKKINGIKSTADQAKPDEAWVVATRSTLLMQVRNSLPEKQGKRSHAIKEAVKIYAPLFVVGKWVRTPVLAVFGIILLGLGGSLFSVSASERSLPGDFFYSIKLATEQAQLALTKDPEQKLKLKTEFTDRRVSEMQQVITMDVANRSDRVIQVAEVLKSDMHTLKQQLDDVKQTGSAETIKETATIVGEKTNAVVQALQDSKTDMNPEEIAKVTEAQAAASDTSVKAVEVLVDAHAQDSTLVSDKDVTDALKMNTKTVGQTMTQSVNMSDSTSTPTVSSSSSTPAVLAQVNTAQKSLNDADKLASEQKLDQAVVMLKQGTQQAFAAQTQAEQDNAKLASSSDTSTPPVVGSDKLTTNTTNTSTSATAPTAQNATDHGLSNSSSTTKVDETKDGTKNEVKTK